MNQIKLAALLVIAISRAAAADVVVPGPPLAPIALSKSRIATMTTAARAAVAKVFDFSMTERPKYLNDTYRAAGKLNISRVDAVVSASIVGDRAYILAVTENWLGPQTMGPTYTYFQARFDDEGRVVSLDIL